MNALQNVLNVLVPYGALDAKMWGAFHNADVNHTKQWLNPESKHYFYFKKEWVESLVNWFMSDHYGKNVVPEATSSVPTAATL